MQVVALKRHAFAHLDWRAAMVQTNDDDFFLHGLFEPASMPAGENRIAPEKVTEHDAKTDHGH